MPFTRTERVTVNGSLDQIRTYDGDGKLIGLRSEVTAVAWISPRLSMVQAAMKSYKVPAKGSGERMA